MEPASSPRLTRSPDFIIIGTMKSGTTSLFRWIKSHPDAWLPDVKEPRFFSDDEVYRKGPAWYGSLFEEAPAGAITGEASVEYADPDRSPLVAARIQEMLPHAKLVCVLREPITRLRSHYRHEIQRGREKRPFSEACRIGSPYVRRSMYGSALAPFFDGPTRPRLLVVSMEGLTRSEAVWTDVLDWIGLPPMPRPTDSYNVTAEKRRWTRGFQVVSKVANSRLRDLTPKPIRSIGKRVLLRDDPGFRAQLEESTVAPLDVEAEKAIRDDVGRLPVDLRERLEVDWR